MLDGAARVGDLVRAAVEDGQPALGITDHGNMYGVLDFYRACREGGLNPVIGTEAYMAGESRHERPVRRGKVDDTGGDVEGGQKLYYHLTLLAETTDGYHNLHEAVVGRLPRGLLLQAPGRLGAARAPPPRAHRHHRLPGRGGAPGAAGRRRGGGRAPGGAPAGHLRPRQPLRRAPGPRHRRPAADQPPTGRHRQAAGGAAAGHQRQPLHPPRGRRRPRRPAVRADRGHPLGPQPLPVRGHRALPEVGRRDAPALRRGPRGLRQHLAHRRAGQGGDRAGPAQPARVPGARAVHRRHLRGAGHGLPPPPHLGRGPAALRRSVARRRAGPPRLRARGHRRHGLRRLLPRGVGPHPLRPRVGDPGGARARFGRRVLRGLLPAHRRPRPHPLRPALRAVLEPRPQADARHRHGLRRAVPRRHDPLRGRALRQRPRGPDRDLLDHQGPGRGARRGPGARPALHRGRPDRQGHAPAGHGARHPAAGLPGADRGPRGRLRRGRRAAHDVRGRPRGQAGHRRGQGPRGAAAPGRHPRRGRGHHQGPADRVPAGPAQARRRGRPRGRADRHPVRDARGRGARPAEDGLPGPAQPVGHRARARPDRAVDRDAARHRRRGPRRRRDLRHAAPGRVGRGLPARGRGHAPDAALARPDELRRRGRPGRPLPTGADGGQHAPRLRRPQERPQAGHLPPPRPRADPGRHLRAHDLPGVGHAGGPEVRRLHAGGGGQPPQGLREEDPRPHRRRAREVRRRLRRQGYDERAGHRSCSTSSSPSPTTPSTSPTPTATASSPTRRPG